MKVVCVTMLVALALANDTSPVAKVINMLEDLKIEVENDHQREAETFSKYSCWCEDTLGGKIAGLDTAREDIDSYQALVHKLAGETASHDAEIKQLEKEVAANLAGQNAAREMRTKEFTKYDSDKTESESSIGAMEEAIKMVHDSAKVATAASGKVFLGTLQEAKVISTLGSLREVVRSAELSKKVSAAHLEVVRKFIEHPSDYLNSKTAATSALQVGQNPFGDYGSQGDSIQGILKGMYDGFTQDLEKSNADEATNQKAHEGLMATKEEEERTLKEALRLQKVDYGLKTSELSNARSSLIDTTTELKADKKFVAQTKAACKANSATWNLRVRLSTEEQASFNNAIQTLQSGVLASSASMFLQTSRSVVHSHSKTVTTRGSAFTQLKALAAKFHSSDLVEVAVEVKMGGHFDKIIRTVQGMISALNAEETADFEHRDRCEEKQTANTHSTEDLQFNKQKLLDQIARFEAAQRDITAKIGLIEETIRTTNTTMEHITADRAEESVANAKSVKDDLEAIGLVQKAAATLSAFYTKNGISTQAALIQTHTDAPTVAEGEEEAEAAPAEGEEEAEAAPPAVQDAYAGKQSSTGGVVAILGMVEEDLNTDVKEARDGEIAAAANFKLDISAAKETMDAQLALKAEKDKQSAALARQIVFRTGDKDEAITDLQSEAALVAAIAKDCDWIASDLATRQAKRKADLAGLREAETYLSGINAV